MPVGITAIGAVTAVGEDAPATVGSIYTEAEAFRCLSSAGRETLAGALTPLGAELTGTDRLAALAAYALREATAGVVSGNEIGLVVCAPAEDFNDEPGPENSFLDRLAADAGILVEQRSRRLFAGGPAATVEALSFARQTLYSRDLPAVCVLGVDSLCTQPQLGRLLRERTPESEPFAPGEAAVALLLTRDLGPDALAILAGVGVSSREAAAIHPNTAKGSASAIEEAFADAELPRAPLSALVHDLPATQAGDEELAWLRAGAFTAAPGICVLTPASSAGVTGAASGILSMASLAFLLAQKEVLGTGACLFSATNGVRGASVLRHSRGNGFRE